MSLSRLDHVNLRTADLAAMQAFYTEVLGMSLGLRPPFSFGGAWLYCGGQATVHLVEVARPPAPEGELRLEHFAFAAEGLADFLARLKRHGVAYRIGVVPDFGIVQVNVHDPDGNHIHVDFAPAEAAAVPGEPALAHLQAGQDTGR
jgi:catechol 2,3-dioxygenase-like lactoylglutathione lyase family enzyme